MAGKRKYTHEQELTALRLKARGASNGEIVAVTGIKERSVRGMVSKFKETFKQLENIGDYESHRTEILTAAELELLKSMMSGEKLEGAKLGEIAKSFHVIHGANRLAKGLSTANIETHRFTDIRPTDFDRDK